FGQARLLSRYGGRATSSHLLRALDYGNDRLFERAACGVRERRSNYFSNFRRASDTRPTCAGRCAPHREADARAPATSNHSHHDQSITFEPKQCEARARVCAPRPPLNFFLVVFSGEISVNMSKELIVSLNGREKKIAIIENERVTEFYIERGEENQGIVGNIYKGRVMRVLPGMQSAFVDIGLERDAFLYVSDFFDEEEEFERIVMDKSKKTDATEAARAAQEQIEQARVEREHRIEATHERAEPLIDAESPTIEAALVEAPEGIEAPQPSV